MILHENQLTPEQFSSLQEAVGFGKPNLKQIELALKNSCYCLSAELDGQIVGMGRLVGDGARIFYLQDVFIMPSYQGIGVGTAIVSKLMYYIKNTCMEGTTVTIGLMAAVGKEGFYEKLGYRIRPNDKEGSGMMMNLKI